MRTTLTLEPDVAEKLKRTVRTRKQPFKVVLNDLLRDSLSQPSRPLKKMSVTVKPICGGGYAHGVDRTKLNQLFDDLEIEEFSRKQALRARS